MGRLQAGAVAAIALVGLLAACGHSPTDADPSETYLDGVEADVVLPEDPAGAPIAVLVPGGAWVEADRSGLTPLAEALADRGVVAVNATYRAAGAGGDLASMVGDIVCATRFAGRRAAEFTNDTGPIVAVGHSSGAHLVALATLAADTFAPSCPDPPAELAGFIGLAGPYDISRIPVVAQPLFGVTPAEDPELWRTGNPLTHAAAKPALPVLLIHGGADELVGVEFTEQFAGALRAGGHAVETRVVERATHQSVYAPEVSADLIADWLWSLRS